MNPTIIHSFVWLRFSALLLPGSRLVLASALPIHATYLQLELSGRVNGNEMTPDGQTDRAMRPVGWAVKAEQLEPLAGFQRPKVSIIV